jgi:hypothetical protein
LGGGLASTVETFVPFWLQTDIDPMAQDGQVPQFNPPPVTVKLGDLTPTVLAGSTGLCAFDGDDVITSFVQAYTQHSNVGNVQGQRN